MLAAVGFYEILPLFNWQCYKIISLYMLKGAFARFICSSLIDPESVNRWLNPKFPRPLLFVINNPI
jgi:hypothetical protein